MGCLSSCCSPMQSFAMRCALNACNLAIGTDFHITLNVCCCPLSTLFDCLIAVILLVVEMGHIISCNENRQKMWNFSMSEQTCRQETQETEVCWFAGFSFGNQSFATSAVKRVISCTFSCTNCTITNHDFSISGVKEDLNVQSETVKMYFD